MEHVAVATIHGIKQEFAFTIEFSLTPVIWDNGTSHHDIEEWFVSEVDGVAIGKPDQAFWNAAIDEGDVIAAIAEQEEL